MTDLHSRKISKPLGRPPKFSGPSRVVTVTLPEATIESLEALDEDRARAIVQATEVAVGSTQGVPDETSVDILAVTRKSAVITVPYSRALSDIEGLNLIQILPSRYLIILEPGRALTDVEVSITDRLDTLPIDESRDRSILQLLLEQLRTFRRSHRTTTGEIILVAM